MKSRGVRLERPARADRIESHVSLRVPASLAGPAPRAKHPGRRGVIVNSDPPSARCGGIPGRPLRNALEILIVVRWPIEGFSCVISAKASGLSAKSPIRIVSPSPSAREILSSREKGLREHAGNAGDGSWNALAGSMPASTPQWVRVLARDLLQAAAPAAAGWQVHMSGQRN
jgi:hypothetical protein